MSYISDQKEMKEMLECQGKLLAQMKSDLKEMFQLQACLIQFQIMMTISRFSQR